MLHIFRLFEKPLIFCNKARNIGFKILTGQGAQINTTTPQGKLVFGMFAVLAEFERELIAERTKKRLASARERGRIGERANKMDKQFLRMAMHAMSNINCS